MSANVDDEVGGGFDLFGKIFSCKSASIVSGGEETTELIHRIIADAVEGIHMIGKGVIKWDRFQIWMGPPPFF